MRSGRPAAALTVAVAVVVGACGASSTEGGCGSAVREALDPQSGVHVLDPAGVRYLTDPPTSGPHLAAAPPAGVQAEPVAAAVQVMVLESGGVMIQYGASTPEVIGRLEALAGPLVVVAPGEGLDDGQVVATAWLHKLSCSNPDTAAIETVEDFIADHRDPTRGHS